MTAGYAQISPPINNSISMRGRADHRRSPPVLGLICLLEIMEAGTIAPYVIVLLFRVAGAVRLRGTSAHQIVEANLKTSSVKVGTWNTS